MAAEIRSVVSVSVSVVLSGGGISTEWAASARECLARCVHGVGSDSLFYPVDHRAQHVELIERRATGTVRHARHQKDAAPLRYFVCAAVGGAKGLVIVKRVKRREPLIAIAMEEDELAAFA